MVRHRGERLNEAFEPSHMSEQCLPLLVGQVGSARRTLPSQQTQQTSQLGQNQIRQPCHF